MKAYHEEAGITIYHGDCRDVLDTLPGDSIDCCVTSPPLCSDVIQFFRSQVKHLHLGTMGIGSPSRADMATLLCNPLFLTGLLDRAESKAISGLGALDSQIWKDHFKERHRFQVGAAPAEQGASALRTGIFRADGSPEEFCHQQYCFVGDLPDVNALAIRCGARVASNPHRVGAFLDSNCAVRVDDSGYVTQAMLLRLCYS